MRIVRNSFVATAMMGMALSPGLGAGSASAAPGEGKSHHAQLTAEQKQCLSDAGFTRENRPEGKPSDEQIASAKAAFEACGISRP